MGPCTVNLMEWIFWVLFIILPGAVVIWVLWVVFTRPKVTGLQEERDRHARAQMKRDRETLGE